MVYENSKKGKQNGTEVPGRSVEVKDYSSKNANTPFHCSQLPEYEQIPSMISVPQYPYRVYSGMQPVMAMPQQIGGYPGMTMTPSPMQSMMGMAGMSLPSMTMPAPQMQPMQPMQPMQSMPTMQPMQPMQPMQSIPTMQSVHGMMPVGATVPMQMAPQMQSAPQYFQMNSQPEVMMAQESSVVQEASKSPWSWQPHNCKTCPNCSKTAPKKLNGLQETTLPVSSMDVCSYPVGTNCVISCSGDMKILETPMEQSNGNGNNHLNDNVHKNCLARRY